MKNLNASKDKKLLILKNKFRSFFSKEFFNNLIIRWLVVVTIFLNTINWILLMIFIRPVDFNIILHYNVYFGVDLIGDWWQTYIIPSMGLIFFIVNFLIAYRFYQQKERIASYILLLASFLMQAGLIIASVGVVIINY